MRPIRLELEGFTAFKEPTVVDFTDTEYFALVGPTGAGKSTIIDAICFALYGSVPRYESRNLVHPVISQGALEAKVRLDFTVQGATYTVVRVVRKSGKGASTKEARLQRGEDVIAATADELRGEIPQLLGLSYDHFTKSVVLPQGEFAAFLHDEPAKRQELIIQLLNLGVYNRMMKLANLRAGNRKNEVALRRQRIDEDFAFATEDALGDKKATVHKLLDVRGRVAEMTPQLLELEKKETEATALIERALADIGLLSELDVPVELADLSERSKAADEQLAAAEKRLADLKAATTTAVEQRARLGDPAPLHSVLKTYDRASSLEKKVADATVEASAAEKQARGAREAATAAEKDLARATEALDAARREHIAAHLAEGLAKGEPCPVCDQTVATLPKHATPSDLERAEGELETASVEARAAATTATEAEKRLAEIRGGLTQLEQEMKGVAEDLDEAPPRGDVEKTLSSIAAADRAVETARSAESEATDACDVARVAIKSLESERGAAKRDFHDARDTVAALKPPKTQDDLAADWAALVEWARNLAPELEAKAQTVTKEMEATAATRESLLKAIAEACAECSVDLSEGDPKEAIASALARAKGDVERIQEGLTGKAKLEQEAADLQTEHDVASSLAQHLSAKGFEKWIVNEALQHLVVGATSILRELSNEQYSLVVDASGNFLVKDHHNADETRLAKTLSGGETFLASLSLALALADQLADLAAEGSARLESIFLDEGFGTLDAETLDIVAATVENLAARGRMVGIVTHVRELADRVPVQFKVTKDPRTSTVEKVVV